MNRQFAAADRFTSDTPARNRLAGYRQGAKNREQQN